MRIETRFDPGDTVYVRENGKVRKRRVRWIEVHTVGSCPALLKINYWVSARNPWAATSKAEAELFATPEEAEGSTSST